MLTLEKFSLKLIKSKFFLIFCLILLLILGGVFYFTARGRKKIPPQTSSYRQLDGIVEKFIDAKKDTSKETTKEDIVEYSIKGILTRMWFEKEVVVYEYDLGKKILLDNKERVSLPVNILPFEYFGKKVAKKEELKLGEGELNLFSELKIWCKVSGEEEKPCQVLKWAIYSLPFVEKPDPYEEIAKKVLAWLETQKNEKGVYNVGQLCRIDGQCQRAGEDNRCGLATIWGRFKYFKKTGRSEDLEIIKKDLATYTDPSKIPVIQNDFWNCRFMHEMWLSDKFSPEEKKKMENICFGSGYSQRPEVEAIIESGPYKEKHNLQEVLAMKRFYITQPTVLSAYGADLTLFSAHTSDFAARFLWKKDPRDLTRAKVFFDKAVDAYKAEGENNYMNGRCVLGVSSLDLYQVSTEGCYLDFATTFFEKEELDKTCLAKEEEVFPNRCQDSIFEQASCALFANGLYEMTKETKYQAFGEELTKNLIEKSFDNQGYKGEFKNDGSFYSWGRGGSEKEVNIFKSVKENGLIIGVLSGKE